jgi:trypsin
MNRIHIALLTGLLSFGAISQGRSLNQFNQAPLIVGGVEATKGEFPFIVSLQDRYGHFCGGSLIKEDWVLTAGHCVDGTSIDKIVIGLHDQDVMDGAEVMKVKKIVPHPKFSMQTVDYDYALIQLDKKSKFKPVDPNKKEMKNPGPGETSTMSTTAGWGTLNENSYSLSKKLQKVSVPLVNHDICKEVYQDFNEVTDRMICAGYDAGSKDSCQGDSGGPLITKDERGQISLIGVVSWGKGCAQPHLYGVYSKISAVYDWIQENAR